MNCRIYLAAGGGQARFLFSQRRPLYAVMLQFFKRSYISFFLELTWIEMNVWIRSFFKYALIKWYHLIELSTLHLNFL